MRKQVKKVIAAVTALAMAAVMLPTGYQSADAAEDEVYGYGTMTMTYAEFYAGDVSSTADMDAVTSATTSKSKTFKNADSTEPDENGYQINGVKNVPVKVMNSASDEMKARVTFYEDETELTQYKTVDADGIGATTFHVADTVTDASVTLKTTSNWGDYEIDVIEESTSYLRNTRSDIKSSTTDEDGNETDIVYFEVNSEIQGIILETQDGYKVGTGHMENIWIQPYEVAFSLDDDAYNSVEFNKLVNQTISKISFIMPSATYVYSLSDGVYIKPAYSANVSGTFSDDGTVFTLDKEVTGLTNATIGIAYKSGRTSVTLLETTELNGTEYTLGTAVPDEVTPIVTISSDNYADITAAYPMLSWQKTSLKNLIAEADEILTQMESSILKEHKTEAEELLANESATAQAAADLITELTSLVEEAKTSLENDSSTESPDPSPTTTPTTEPTTQPTDTLETTAPTNTPAPTALTGTAETTAPTDTSATDTPAAEESDTTASVKKGSTYTAGSLKVKVTNAATDGKGTVQVTAPKSKSAKSISVPAKVKVNGVTLKVTAIAKNAFAGCSKLSGVTIGSNVKTIGANAFKGDSKLKKITINTKVLTSVGSNALKGINSKAVIRVPSAKKKAYKKLLKGKGQSSKVTIK
ncbi:MAG: leucine-rich repeat protein [Clostridiaceae bacterium]|nr:leucine-rich repeat protein [Clostridiaceae bacterium]